MENKDVLSKEKKIYLALDSVYKAFKDGGKGLEISVGDLLKNFDVTGHAYIALGIKALGLIKVEKQNDGRAHCIAWNNSVAPNMQIAENLIDLAQKFKTGKFQGVEDFSADQLKAEIKTLEAMIYSLRADNEALKMTGPVLIENDVEMYQEQIAVLSDKCESLEYDLSICSESADLNKTIKAYRKVLKDILK